MCSVENVNKISTILKVNPGKLGYNLDKIVTRTTKSNELLSGFTTILLSIASESREKIVKSLNCNAEIKAMVSQWIEYSVNFINASSKDKHSTSTMLSEINEYLKTRSYFVGNDLSLADLAVFFTVQNTMSLLSMQDKENYINLARWFNHLQQNNLLRPGGDFVNFTTINLIGWVSGTHI